MAVGFRPRAALFGLQQEMYEPQPTAMQQQLQQPLPQPTPEPKKAGFFGEGGAGRAIAGYIGDALLAQSGMRPMYAPAMAEQRQLLMAQKLAESKRMGDRQDWVWQQQNRVRDPHRWESNDGSLMEIGPDGQPRVVYKDPNPKTEWINVRNPDGTMTIMPKPQTGTPPTFNPSDWERGVPLGGAGSDQRGFR